MKLVLTATLLATSIPSLAQQSPSTMPKVGTADARFQSYNIEMVEVIGGKFWKPYSSAPIKPPTGAQLTGIDPSLLEKLPPADLADPRLRKLTAALGPAYLRVSGTWANTVFFQDSDAPQPATPPEGFGGVLTRAQWKSVIDFSRAVDAPIVTSFSVGRGTRDANGVWTTTEAKKFIDATHRLGGSIAAAEFINEPTFIAVAGVSPTYSAADYGRDFAVFQPFFRAAAPEAILLGPGSVGEGIPLAPMKLLPSKELLAATRNYPIDAFSYHFYGTISERCSASLGPQFKTTLEAALSEDWLDRTTRVADFYAGLRDTYAPAEPLWLTETGQAACGGDRWAATFVDTFRYLNQLGALARRGVRVVMHNTLDASDYGLIDSRTLIPRPNYWAALLWHNTMGPTVLDPGPSSSATLRFFAHCMKNTSGGVTLLALNLNPTAAQTIKLPTASARYTLTARTLTNSTVQLNNQDLTVTPTGDIPTLSPAKARRGNITLPPASITFFTIATANNAACKL